MEFYLERLDTDDGGRRIRLAVGTVSIGRSPKCTIALPAQDRCASGFHAVIYVDPGRLLLQDMQSTNGTFVNGRQMQECVVEAGDEIGVGRSGPRFRVAASGGVGETGGIDGGTGAGWGDGIDSCVGTDAGDNAGDGAGINTPIASVNSTSQTPRNAPAVNIIMAAAGLIVLVFMAVMLMPLMCRPVDTGESSPAKKNFFSSPAEEASAPAPTQSSTPVSMGIDINDNPSSPSATAGRIDAILIRFGEESYRAPPEMVERVDHYLDQFTGKKRRAAAGYMERKKRFFPMIQRIFSERNVPPELAYVSMLESGFNTAAKSHAGAVGLWQFMPATARRYGLEVSPSLDERTDPEKATCAAAAYFKDLIAIFGARSSVMLCMAAYNAGEARVINALKKIDDPVRDRDFWYLYRMGWLAEETNEYIPQIIALMIISENLAEYGFEE
ncbi:MAG: transglycosylase SLT domain-containing protein [Chitinispirillia bacterium]|nr:transglycosylase SLT domain-containing protein [Chitinispirillia bacterium]MCL2242746.1 transglycosylase SLT domain-containing protein [Chitinispirillia bacterium]